jgi:dephospho-CoA kinase
VRLFGLTGGIGSGKSTVARRFRARGLPVIDADELARDAVAKGSDGLDEIVQAFGVSVLTPGGELDRKAVAARVFHDDDARRTLNAIVHPRVVRLSSERVNELDARGEPLGCYEVPLLFETRIDGALRPIVVVSAPVEAQVARTMTRDGATEDDVLARIRAQLPLAEKASRADYVIDNAGSLEVTLARADDVLDAICRGAGVDVSRYPRL